MNRQEQFTISIVLYNNDLDVIRKTIQSVIESNISSKLILIDNSTVDNLKCLSSEFNLIYHHNILNTGFGTGHNLAIKKYCSESKFHLFLNPDITFDTFLLSELINYLNLNQDVGILMPKIIYPNGTNQKLAKLSPGILDLLIRRLPFLQYFFNNFLIQYELRHYKYDKIIDIPFLSGCFLLCKTEIFKNIGGFDENLFLYMEDVDLTRRFISYGKRSVVYPFAYAIHDHEYKKIDNLNSFKIFFNSAFYYFNKWGWFLDKERKFMNTKTLNQII